MSTSITILPARLLLVHIPRDKLRQLMFNVLDCMWWKPKEDSFFSLCENGLEVSLFADEATVRRAFASFIPADFDDPTPLGSDDDDEEDDSEREEANAPGPSAPTSPAASADESGFTLIAASSAPAPSFTHPFDAEQAATASRSKGKGKGKAFSRRGSSGRDLLMETGGDSVKVGRKVWTALEIEIHENGWEDAGQRVRDISSPLAERGISILFLSTYASDFILVPTAQLERVTSVLTESGFNFSLDDEDESSPDQSPAPGMRASFSSSSVLSPTLSNAGGAMDDSLLLRRSIHSRARAGSNSTHNTGSGSLSNSLVLSEHSNSSAGASAVLSRSESSARAHPPAASPGLVLGTGPGGPLGGGGGLQARDALELLTDELVCVGLQKMWEAVWREKIVQALFFPERVLPLLEEENEVTRGLGEGIEGGLEMAGRVARSKSKSSSPVMMRTMSLSRSNSTNSRDFPQQLNRTNSNRSSNARSKSRHRRPPLRQLSSGAGGSQQPTPRQEEASPARGPPPPPHQAMRKKERKSNKPTPFIALTMTSSQASLTADIRLLRALFDEDEQERMVHATGGGLNALWQGEEEEEDDDEEDSELGEDDELIEGVDSLGLTKGGRGRTKTRDGEPSPHAADDDDDEPSPSRSRASAERQARKQLARQAGESGRRLLKCLQLDLVGSLDTPGVVEAYAGLLIKGGVNLLYQSTFQSANILVSKAQSKVAKSILEQSWRRSSAEEEGEGEVDEEGGGAEQ